MEKSKPKVHDLTKAEPKVGPPTLEGYGVPLYVYGKTLEAILRVTFGQTDALVEIKAWEMSGTVDVFMHLNGLDRDEIELLEKYGREDMSMGYDRMDGQPMMDIDIRSCDRHKRCIEVRIEVLFSSGDWKRMQKRQDALWAKGRG